MDSHQDESMIELPVFPIHREDLRPPPVDAAIVTAALIADRARASILEVLHHGPRCVCELAVELGAPEHTVAAQLSRLREAGLVRPSRSRVHDHWTFYERDETACSLALRNLAAVLA
jgi:DNA-binding transcriptional ArsR family regulator